MTVEFKHGDQIYNTTWKETNDTTVFTYIGKKGYGDGEQHVFYCPKDDRAFHFTKYDADNWAKYVPGLKVGKAYRFNDTSTSNVYHVLYEHKHSSGDRSWVAKITYGVDGVETTMSPYYLGEHHVDRLVEVDVEDEW